MVNRKLFFIWAIVFLVIAGLGYVLSVQVIPSSLLSGMNISEDVSNLYNFTINNTNSAAPSNYTQINITFPSNFTLDLSTIGTGALNTSSLVNGQTLSWTSSSILIGLLNSSNFWVNASTPNPGTYNITVKAMLFSGAVENTSILVSINDTTAPSVTAVYPASFGNYSLDSMPYNLTVTDNSGPNNISSCWFNLGNDTAKNFTLYDSTNSVFNAFNASYNIGNLNGQLVHFFCNDTNKNVNSSISVNFSIDTVAPVNVNITTPASNGINITSSPYVLNATANDTAGGTGLATIYFNITNSAGATGQVAYLLGVNTSAMNKTTASNWTFSLVTRYNATYPDGNYSIAAYAFDHAGNVNKSVTRNITIDNYGPVITLISPDDATTSSTISEYNFTFNATGPVAISSCYLVINDVLAQYNDSTISPVLTGIYNATIPVAVNTWSINCTDVLGVKSNSSTRTLIVFVAPITTVTPSGGSLEVTLPYWTSTFVLSDSQFVAGETKELGVKARFRFTIANAEHSAGVIALTSTTATINISSTPQQATLQIGDERRFEVTSDDYYDVYVKLNSIINNKASVTIKSIHEFITAETEAAELVAEEEATAEAEIQEEAAPSIFTQAWFWVVVAAIVIIVIVLIIQSRKQKYYKKGYSKKWD